MKILTKEKQQHLMALIYRAQKSAEDNDFFGVTDFLTEIAGEVLTLEQLCVLRDEICNNNKRELQAIVEMLEATK